MPDSVRDCAALMKELRGFQGGLADTSTLIYLERLSLLECVIDAYRIGIIPQVAQEYRAMPSGAVPLASTGSDPADLALCRVAKSLNQPVLSEDKKVLRAARAQGLPHYNTLMIVLAMCLQGRMDIAAFAGVREQLLQFAHYSRQVIAAGDALFAAMQDAAHQR